jgi:hypothetical protein
MQTEDVPSAATEKLQWNMSQVVIESILCTNKLAELWRLKRVELKRSYEIVSHPNKINLQERICTVKDTCKCVS